MAIHRHRNFIPALCALLFVLYVNGWLWWALSVAAAGYLVWSTHKRLEAQRAADAVIAARADLQHTQTLAGDERGIYGQGYQTVTEYLARQRIAEL